MYNSDEIKQIRKCLSHLNRSFAKYIADDKKLTYDESCDVKEVIDKMWYDFICNTTQNDDVSSAKINTQNVNKASSNDVRNLIATAKMVNADGLIDFVNGNFYTIRLNDKNGTEMFDIVQIDGQSYVGLLDDNGVAHYINKNRLNLLKVFAEPPKNTTEMALS
jgi:hypothetical protein